MEFWADIPVASDRVSYSVSPKPGFVFDEWKITRASRTALKNKYLDRWWDVLFEIQKAIRDDSQTIYINPEYIEYIRPTFDRGYYLAPGAPDGGDGSADNPFTSLDALIKTLTTDSISRYDDDELTIKIRKGDVSGSFDLSGLSTYYTDDIELKLIGGYDNDWNLSQNKTVISSITFPSLSGNSIEELEIELRNIELTELDYEDLPRLNDDFEIDFRNCSVSTLKNASGKIVNGLVVENLDGSSSKVVFINSSAPYEADSKYYHSVVRGAGTSISGRNNIVLAAAPVDGSGSGDGTDNLYLEPTGWNGYKTENQDLISRIITARPLSEDFHLSSASQRDDDFEADDLLEEDIEGRERYLSDDGDDDDRSSRDSGYRNIRVSYGPYEYIYFED